MTQGPSQTPGNFHPPPPISYPPPYSTGVSGYPPPPRRPADSGAALPRAAYTPWIVRVAASLVDGIPLLIAMGIGFGMLAGTQETECLTEMSDYDIAPFCSTGSSTLGLVSFWIALVLSVAFGIWNHGYRQGTTGSSIGKSLMKSKVVSEKTGLPIGFGLSLVRQIAHVADLAICWIGYLFPLWDRKRQTLADMIMTTVCLPL